MLASNPGGKKSLTRIDQGFRVWKACFLEQVRVKFPALRISLEPDNSTPFLKKCI